MDSDINPNQSTQKFAYSSLEDVRKKLLNLSTINPLISYKHPTASCLPIVDELPDQIYEELQNGNSFTFIPVPEPKEQELIDHGYLGYNEKGELIELKSHPKPDQWAKILGINTDYELPQTQKENNEKHNDKNLQTIFYASSLEARLRNIKTKAQTELEESGSNVLYLVLGFLEYFEAKSSTQTRLAPLFTIPVHIERTRLDRNEGVYRYKISLKDEGLMTNITLKEKLIEQSVDLPLIDDITTPEAYFREIQHTMLQHKPKWKIQRRCTLAILNFSKQAMYEDLDPKNWPQNKKFEDHPIIKSFFESQAESESPDKSESNNFKHEHYIDNIADIHQKYPLIFDADSSQHSALIDAANGENLVIEGPPGSGKSQTITNLIAACLANGKRVLFVAEKMAALEVVKSRLDQAELGDFCLELHSHKTNKRRILSDLEIRINKQDTYSKPSEIDTDIERFEDLKLKLNKYVNEINSTWKNTGLTIHQILNKSTRFQNEFHINLEKIRIDNINGETFTPIRAKEINDYIKNMIEIFQQVQEQASEGKITNHYWFGVNNSEILSHQQDELIDMLKKWDKALNELNETISDFILKTHLPENLISTLDDTNTLASIANQLPALNGHEPLTLIKELKGSSHQLELLLEEYLKLENLYQSIAKILEKKSILQSITPEIISTELNTLLSIGAHQDTSLEDLQLDYEKAKNFSQVSFDLKDQLDLVKQSLPQNIQEIASGSFNSFKELLDFIGISNTLPANMWQHRSDIYDSPELDGFIEKFTPKFNALLQFYNQVQSKFNLEKVPDSSTLLDIRATLDNTGFFSIFNKS